MAASDYIMMRGYTVENEGGGEAGVDAVHFGGMVRARQEEKKEKRIKVL